MSVKRFLNSATIGDMERREKLMTFEIIYAVG